MGTPPLKVMFVGRSTSHFSYYESVVAALRARGAVVDFVLDKRWSKSNLGGAQGAISEFTAENAWFKHGWAPRRADKWRDLAFKLRELRSYRSYIARKQTTPFYIKRWKGYLTPGQQALTEKAWFRALLRLPLTGWAMEAFERWVIPPDPGVTEFIKKRAPDAMVLSPMNMRFSEDTDYCKAAKALGLPTAVSTLSWDNLSTKGILQVKPDLLFVWNKYQASDAYEIQKMPEDRVMLAGSPFFDKWFDNPSALMSREDFCAQLGFDPAKKILLYLGSSKNIAKDESWLPASLRKRLRGSKKAALKDCQILVRPHPANADIYAELDGDGLRVWPKDGALPETRAQFLDMRNSFHHADAAVGINTSGMIDAVLADLPTFSILLERYAHTQSDSKHFQYLQQGDALAVMDDEQGFIGALAEVFKGQDAKAETRRAFAQMFARPQGLERSAGDVIAERMLQMAAEKRARG
jgi:hypothetical protein